MKKLLSSILQGFEYDSSLEFLCSLVPSIKYQLLIVTLFISTIVAEIDVIFGLDAMAVGGLIAVMLLELGSGTYASRIQKQPFSSRRLSRFTFKMACYLILISVPYLFEISFKKHGNGLASGLFGWLHVFLVVQIVVENIVSILENLALIQGKDKTYWIKKIKSKIDTL